MNIKKQIRYNFRKAVFIRDSFKCVICGLEDSTLKQDPESNSFNSVWLDSHHIVPREKMPNGGYVKENGISLCKDGCHLKAEEYLQGVQHESFSPEELYKKIRSSYELAVKFSKRLNSED